MVLALFGFGHTSLLKSQNETRRRTENIEDIAPRRFLFPFEVGDGEK